MATHRNTVERTSPMSVFCSPAIIRKSIITAAIACALFSPVVAQELPESEPPKEDLSAADVAAYQQFGQKLGVADWLGPLAPVALSPFFGILCLSAMSLYGGDWVSADNAFLGDASPLHNPAIFWTFLVLTLITSIPRLTKVSKPFAQAVDQVEAWAGIITLLALKLMMGADAPELEQLSMVELGIVSATTSTLLMIAGAINVFVINTVKFFFEVLIWITPIPAVDAIFEVANKVACATLMAIYGYSPTIATGINLVMFVIAAFVFSWVYRREVFFRTALLDAVWAFFAPPKGVTDPELVVFPAAEVGPFLARTRCRLHKTESGWTLTQQRFLRSDIRLEIPAGDCTAELDAGFFTNTIKLSGTPAADLTFSRWYNQCLPDLADKMGAQLNAQDAAALADRSGLQAEMS